MTPTVLPPFAQKPDGPSPEPALSRYQAIFEQCGQGIALMDSRFVLTAVNPAMCRLLGYQEGELLGHEYLSLISPGDLVRQPSLIKEALAGQQVTVTRLLQRKDGTPVTVKVSVRRVSDDEVVMIFWDKTESIEHQNALARERRRLRTLLDTIPGPVWSLRRDMSLAATNAIYDAMTGGRRSCFCTHKGETTSEPCSLCPTRLVLETGLPSRRECVLKDGRVFLISAVPFQGEEGEPLSLGLAVDITAHKALERQLDAARQTAEAATQAKSVFLASVSHEIRTPLNSVLGHLQLLEEGPLSPSQAESVRMALGSGRLLMRLIDDILDLSRIEAGKIAFIQEDFQVRDITSMVLSVLGPAAEAKGLALACTGPKCLVRSDPARISQIAINLAGNAVKYTDKGSVRITFDLGPGQDGRWNLAILVEDSGPGIPEDRQSTIFKEFTQLDPSARSTFGGVGLGLAIVKQLVTAMGGELALTSSLGRGTTVSVRIPVEKPGSLQDAGADDMAAGQTARPLRLLVVEDEKVNQMVMVKAVERRGHRAAVASNGLEALEVLKAQRFDAVLMDLMMPFMDGLEAARAIRDGLAGEEARGVPIVAVSAHAMDSDRALCSAAGMDAHLSKPIELAELDRLLARIGKTASVG